MLSVSKSLSIVVPCYCSCKILPDLVKELANELPNLSNRYEVILVNDGSPDNTWQVILDLAQEYKWIRGVNLTRNFGQHNALLCGIRMATNEIVITIDDDMQNPPTEISKLIGKLNEGFDVVYGSQSHRDYGLMRSLATIMTKWILKSVIGIENARKVSPFRAFWTHLRDTFADYRGSFVSIDVLLSWATSRFSSVYTEHRPRTIGSSNYNWYKLFTHSFNLLTGFTVLPLQFASILGFICTIFGIGILIYVLGRYFLFGSPVAGFTFLASSIAIFSGAQLLALGIIGEYLARMHYRLLDKPPYAIGEKVNID